MIALSVQQPYAFAIVNGFKDLENRTWRHSHRGETLIHTGKKEISDDVDGVLRMIAHQTGFGYSGLLAAYKVASARRGGVVGRVLITGHVTDHDSQWFNGPHAFVLARPQWCGFIECPGQRGFFDIPVGNVKFFTPDLFADLGLARPPT